MRPYLIFLLLCSHLLPTSIPHPILSQALTLQQVQGIEREAYGDAIKGKHELKIGKGPYGGANMNHDPRTSKNNAPSQLLPRSFSIGIRFGFSLFLFFGF